MNEALTTDLGSQRAFPNDELSTWPGLTKRELFAAMAMQGMLANSDRWTNTDNSDEEDAHLAIAKADALLAVLEKGGT